MAKPPAVAKPAEGVEFPLDDKGARPTMGVNKGAFAAAIRAISTDDARAIDELPEKKWRRAYQKNVVEQVRQCAKSPDAALGVARAGLDYLHKTMVFVRPAGADASAVTLQEAMVKYTDKKFHLHEVQGTGPRPAKYTVQYKPYGRPGPLRELSGDELHRQIDTWVRDGAVELSCGAAMAKVVDNPEWCDLRDLYFVLFGASSAMGPFFKLMDLGANVIAIDLDRPAIWEKLLREARSRPGKLIFPVKEPVGAGASDAELAKVAGCNLLTDTPEIRTWLQDLFPQQRLVCMALAYLDGALFVKVSMAMDAIIASLIEKRGADKVAVAFLCTPTDVHLCTPASVEAAKKNIRRAPAWQGLLAPLLTKLGFPMKKNLERPIADAPEGLHVVDCVIPEQGPNYLLAKRLQHWRAMLARSAGCTVSSNIAPSTATASVLSNVLFALGYKGMSYFRPMEITYQQTSNSVMAALLIRDLRDPSSAANPRTPLQNPLQLFTENAWHGGCWRAAWKFSSLGAPAVIGYVCTAFLIAPYLLLYSAYQASGWLRILSSSVTLASSGGSIWTHIGPTVTFFQHLGFMEVAHAAVGFTSSSAVTTFVQIFSRTFVIALLNECPTGASDTSLWVPMLLFAWSLADLVRYIYYVMAQLRDIATSTKGVMVALKMVKARSVEESDEPVFAVPFPLLWLRYSLFLVLYPMGVSGELRAIVTQRACMLAPTPALQPGTLSAWVLQTMRSVLHGPGLSEGAAMGVIFVGYAIGLPTLYLMLWGARKKVLGGRDAAKKARKEASAAKKAS